MRRMVGRGAVAEIPLQSRDPEEPRRGFASARFGAAAAGRAANHPIRTATKNRPEDHRQDRVDVAEDSAATRGVARAGRVRRAIVPRMAGTAGNRVTASAPGPVDRGVRSHAARSVAPGQGDHRLARAAGGAIAGKTDRWTTSGPEPGGHQSSAAYWRDRAGRANYRSSAGPTLVEQAREESAAAPCPLVERQSV